MKRNFSLKRTLALSTSMIFAGAMAYGLTVDEVVQDFTAQGYTRIEIDASSTRIKVEAIRGTEKVEIVYDAVTGVILKSETGQVTSDDSTTSGVSISTDDENDDESDDESDDSEDDSEDDSNDDGDDSSDDSKDDDSGSDDGGDDD